jgi:oxygen-dependent protoporphyrinogen oxidase
VKSIAIIGAGITGLAAAYELQRRGIAAEVFESGSEPGGVIGSACQDGFLAERGPNTLLETSPAIPALIRELGMEREMVYSNPAAKNKYIIRGGKPLKAPGSVAGFLATPLFSWKAKLRLMREPFIAPSSPQVEESLGEFARRRLGGEFLDYAIDPFVAGIYAGDPLKLSAREAFGKVYQLEQKYGSLIKGQFLGARERRKSGTVSKQNAAKISFREGLQSLPRALAQRLKTPPEYGTRLRALEQTPEGWQLRFDGLDSTKDFRAVLLTIPSHALSAIEFQNSSGSDFAFADEIRYAPVSSIVMGFRREQVRHPLDGFGFLVPEVERMSILGAIFNSSLFPHRAPANHVTITCYLGGMRSPELPFASTEKQLELVSKDLERTLGTTGEPVFTLQTTHARAIPQYELGYGKVRGRIEAIERDCRGLFLGGNYRGGVSLSDSLLNGLEFGKRIAANLNSAPTTLRAQGADLISTS